MIKIMNNKITGPQNGSVTHHQDQLITPTSFNTMKAIPNSPKMLGNLKIICFSIYL